MPQSAMGMGLIYLPDLREKTRKDSSKVKWCRLIYKATTLRLKLAASTLIYVGTDRSAAPMIK